MILKRNQILLEDKVIIQFRRYDPDDFASGGIARMLGE